MGSALLRGWAEKSILDPDAVTVVEPDGNLRSRVAEAHRVTVVPAVPESWSGEVVLFAVKPQVLEPILPAYRPHCGAAAAISIAAGKNLKTLAEGLGATVPIVRAMPNLPASVGRGVSVAVSNRHVNRVLRARVQCLLGAVGSVHWIDDETWMDAVTALSGSGPAYVFLLTEAMTEAGKRAGLPNGLARDLARETVAGASALLVSGGDPAELRVAVTSPGGTTEAAVRVLTDGNRWSARVQAAVAAAAARSRELAAIRDG